MLCRKLVLGAILSLGLVSSSVAAPNINPISNATIPAGKSLTIPITATSTSGRPLTYTVTSSTNRISIEVHTNNPFWKLSVVQAAPANAPGAFQTPFRGASVTVTNVGDMTLMLFRDRAPKAVDIFQGFSMAGFYNSNTIFHRVIPGFMIQGGDPQTNGTGGPVFRYDDEFHPRTIFSGHGQLALANSGKDTCGSQFFITQGPQRFLDFGYTLFGQLLRGFEVLTNTINTPRGANDRPNTDVIITQAAIITNYTDTVITLNATNFAGVSGTITVIADDGTVGGRATNIFTATTATDTWNNNPFLFPANVTNLTAPVNGRITNYLAVTDLEGNSPLWDLNFLDNASFNAASNSTFISTNGQLVIIPNPGYVGPVRLYAAVSPDFLFSTFDLQTYTFAIGDTTIVASPTNFIVNPLQSFTNQLLATFTNGVANSPTGNFTATINWGDNSVSNGSIITNSNGRKEVLGSHTYTNSGHYPIYITIDSVLGAQATAITMAYVRPTLRLSRANSLNTLRWPGWAAEYQLQTLTNLSAGNWASVTNFPTLVGYENVVTNTSTSSNLFFRLKR